ncbi:efflux RND transporter periplasmic adaptor subunit [Aliirhizobium cellulosilyticum]|uniref:Multidrug efflux system membrane fusion protein n=1 Tax=Aliirhizobium cellulosilyticum TaxID=393664 RepID=A0A7W6UZ36_9HYPH|nr:efflux RND transporter periplasmic adaptor subunit [Rhizobium cellulosilyticum]MBB4349410.1 multidrug efflux system membrane fusion protein [Rhizobium cellulosilyticum]MBB4412368.1 multidrug efflux system membrane fusion protein [Rhizobium cellulosilyticum]MBB4447000.1 multidrug efflux system membrane fusion protein [Rhizobium cellulosilyticum]
MVRQSRTTDAVEMHIRINDVAGENRHQEATDMFPCRQIYSRRIFARSTASAVIAACLILQIPRVVHAQAISASSTSIPVQVTLPTAEDVAVYLTGLGTAQAENTVSITSQIDGEIQSIHFTEGQHVARGDLLVVIDPRPYQAALDQANARIQQDQADLGNARYLLGKDTTLAAQQIVTQEVLEQQRAQVENLEAQLALDTAAKEAAEVSLSYTQIKAPIDGVTGILAVDPGNQIRAASGTAIVTITQVDPISTISTLKEGDLEEVEAAMQSGSVPVIAKSIGQARVLATGKVSLIDNVIDEATGSIRIKSTFPNPKGSLWPGEAVSISLRAKVLVNALTIPSAAVQRGPDGFFVYVVDDTGKAQVKPISVGETQDERTVVTSGISSVEKVVVTGQYRLSPNVTVTPSDYVAASQVKD